MGQTYIERSALPALPFFLLLLAAGLTGMRKRWTSVTVGVLTAAASALILISFFHYREHWTVYKPNPDWRQTALYLGAEMASHDEIRSLYSFHPSPTALSYYDRRIQEVKYLTRDDDKIERVLTDLSTVFGDEGFPGAAVNNLVGDLYREFSEYHDRNEAVTRLRVFPPGWTSAR